MKQTLHIFAKDVRCLLQEILIVLSLAAAFVSISSYLGATDPPFRSAGLDAGGKLAKLLPLLIAFIHIAWILLVCRVIRAERLAGDTQFWITRPYEWEKLLAAKLLFVMTFVYLPVVAGFAISWAVYSAHPHPDVAKSFLGGLGNVLGYMNFVVLPVAAIATVSASVASVLLNIFYALGSMFAVVLIPIAIRPDSVPGPWSGNICWILTLLICGVVILLQYARRKTRLSVMLLVAIPVLICAISIFTPERRPPDRTRSSQTTVSRPG